MPSSDLMLGDCREVLAALPDNYADAIVTDPPYGLTANKKGGSGAASLNLNSPAGRSRITTGGGSGGFMNLAWDASVPGTEYWAEMLRVAKPGAHLLAFGGDRTHHRLMCAIEDAGWELRTCIYWMFSTGFPKSKNIGGGLGTALKPAAEVVVWAQKRLTSVPPRSNLLIDVQNLIGGVLCQLLFNANSAELLFSCSQSESDAESTSALLIAAVLHGSVSLEWREKMGTFNSPETVAMCSNIAKSWNNILGAVCDPGNKFTTSTEIALTTGLRILNSCLSRSIPAAFIEAVSRHAGTHLSVPTADIHLKDGKYGKRAASEHSVRTLASLRQICMSADSVNSRFEEAARAVDTVLSDVITVLGRDSRVELRPAAEIITLARKPLEGTVEQNYKKYGTGVLNIDGCRIPAEDGRPQIIADYKDTSNNAYAGRIDSSLMGGSRCAGTTTQGRWPAALCHDGSDEVLACFPNSAGQLADVSDTAPSAKTSHVYGAMKRVGEATQEKRYTQEGGTNFAAKPGARRADKGSAARFFHCAKMSRGERNYGCDHLPDHTAGEVTGGRAEGSAGLNSPRAGAGRTSGGRNRHPTAKPIALMRWLCRLVTPPGGLIIDPFCGSGSTGIAAMLEDFSFLGIDQEQEWITVAEARIVAWMLREDADAVTGGGR